MRRALPSLTLAVSLAFLGSVPRGQQVVQTDWSGGDGVAGPLAAWADTFAAADGVSWRAIPGQLALSSMALSTPVSYPIGGASLAFAIHAADLDGDGDQDVVGTSEADGEVLWWRNDGGTPPVWTEFAIDPNLPAANGIMTADMDLDGRIDVVVNAVGTVNELSWYRNVGGDPIVWTKHTVDPLWINCYELAVADVNLDGRPDVVAASMNDKTVAWWENVAGSPPTWTKHVVDSNFDGAHCAKAADVDGDGDMDFVAIAGVADEVAWWRNDGGTPTVWTKHVIRTGYTGGRSVDVADFDHDGDLDIAATCWTSHVSVFKNEGGSPLVWTEEILASNFTGGHHVRAADVSGDGLLDVVAAGFMINDVVWWENGGGSPTVWIKQTVAAGFPRPTEIGVADVDGDGALEVLAAGYTLAGRFWWYEATEFVSYGELTSAIVDSGAGFVNAKLDWDADVPAGTTLHFQVRSGPDAASMGAWSADVDSPGVVGDLGRFVQYRAFLENTDPTVSPVVREVSLATPRVTYRNGAGTNPFVFTSTSLPRLGTAWTAEVDGAGLGASGQSLVVGYAAPLSPGASFGVGELLFDPASAWYFLTAAALLAGIGFHSIAVPGDLALVGFPLTTQAFLEDVGGSGRLTNAIDLVLGQ